MRTMRSYYENIYQTEFEAVILACEKRGEQYYIMTDHTLFYPEGGGQPADLGTLGGAKVMDVIIENDEIYHITDAPFEVGAGVDGKIDWDRRFDFMQQHSGEHIVSGFIHKKYGYDNVGFHMGEEYVTIDLSGMLTESQLREIEDMTNQYIWSNQNAAFLYPREDELEGLDYRSKKELTGEVRIVEFPGSDRCACCGLHVGHTGEIGLVKIVSAKKFKKGIRIEMLSGKRAVDYLRIHFQQNTKIAAALSVKCADSFDAVKRLEDEIYTLKGEIAKLNQEKIREIAKNCQGKKDLLYFVDSMEPIQLRKCTDEVLNYCSGTCVMFSGSEEEGYKYAIGKRQGDISQLVKEMNVSLAGRGGGKPEFAQGSVTALKEDIESFFHKKGFTSLT